MKTVLTGQDIAGVRIGKKIVDIPLLADGVVRYIGRRWQPWPPKLRKRPSGLWI